MKSTWQVVLMLAGFGMSGMAAHAEVQQKVGTFAGLNVTYRVILPDNYDENRAYPTVLHFAGGSQNLDIVERSTETDWRENAEQRGYIVISPASPNGELYFEGADRIFPSFIDHILKNYKVAGGKLHITGHSNGGLSAFHIASLFPQYFVSVTGYPGLLSPAREPQLAALKPLCIYMHVGDGDPGWLSGMQSQYQSLRGRGYKIQFQIEKGHVHRLDTKRDNLANRLFDELEAAVKGC